MVLSRVELDPICRLDENSVHWKLSRLSTCSWESGVWFGFLPPGLRLYHAWWRATSQIHPQIQYILRN